MSGKKYRYLVVIALLLTLSVSVHAMSRSAPATPTLTFSNSTAMCSVNIYKPSQTISAVIELWYGNSMLDSWSGTGNTYLSISGSCPVVSGLTYTLYLKGSLNGIPFETTSVIETCP